MRIDRRVVSFMACVVLLAGLVMPFTGRAAQDEQADLRDRSSAAATAQRLLDLAAQANYLGMYDELHPDARQVSAMIATLVATNIPRLR